MTPPRANLLVEIGTEELPPLALRRLSEALGREIAANLDAAGLGHGELSCFATPRRLAVLILDVETEQAEKESARRGPALNAAFDAEGNPTKAALGFARSCGVAVTELEELHTEEGSWLFFRRIEPGRPTISLLPAIVSEALPRLPVPKRMRWGERTVEFARPVHWVVLLFGKEVVETEIMDIVSGRVTRGHRFHHPEPLRIEDPTDYAQLLRDKGQVVADFDTRKEMIREQVRRTAESLGGKAIITDALLEEVTALVEWPVVVAGGFEEKFLALPGRVLMGTMAGHQKYFPVEDGQGNLMPHFITVSNIESRNPESVQRGNERVVRPRLSDAAFFFEADLRQPLAGQLEGLKSVVFQKKLGSLHDKSERVSRLAGQVAEAMGRLSEMTSEALGEEIRIARRAGLLCKCDLLTQVVGELPELQGYMGRIYGERAGEPSAVATALEEVYWPRFAGDAIPATRTGRAVAIADKLDTLVGIFGIGQFPKGDRDPFALRRAALGVLRILVEGELDLALPPLLEGALAGFGETGGSGNPRFDTSEVGASVLDFMTERLRAYFSEQGIEPDVFAAVAARRPERPLDFAMRARAVTAFRALPESASLAAANKRIRNILRKIDAIIPDRVEEAFLREDAERVLAARLAGITPTVTALLARGDYTAAMTHLAGLRDDVDGFFEAVLVMAKEEKVRNNRLALLRNIHALFSETADISLLA
uniref:Glycine--tRNA ligase beta subunit n=1 Tax=Candidatus Kentrum sp. DK TaxID=2126562 RepID=A0A450SK73_9GAMM|nr:MAG: glycyl-tRNA synthetase beta chain [Candidatus Kentron sp. DK]